MSEVALKVARRQAMEGVAGKALDVTEGRVQMALAPLAFGEGGLNEEAP